MNLVFVSAIIALLAGCGPKPTETTAPKEVSASGLSSIRMKMQVCDGTAGGEIYNGSGFDLAVVDIIISKNAGFRKTPTPTRDPDKQPNQLVRLWRKYNPNDVRSDDEITMDLARKYPDRFKDFPDAEADRSNIFMAIEAICKSYTAVGSVKPKGAIIGDSRKFRITLGSSVAESTNTGHTSLIRAPVYAFSTAKFELETGDYLSGIENESNAWWFDIVAARVQK